ncbi:Holliday junction resolvase RuvX [Bergeyella sp. RCAD1439]|uniref:Holliday junction resolvase RuvX n=1 Tax=Bergeyella anatis TaxID=3113737 RepID=UPI002E184299|nr:Holliday junction resolvase RuvX [Bergeyella sp. RCAD1439]
MGQIMAIDYGKKRTGLAVTDDFQIVASGLDTVETERLMPFLERYFSQNVVDEVVVGLPVDLRGKASEVEASILTFIERFRSVFPLVPVHRYDERFTSKMASFFISQSGKGKKARQDKGLIDKVSATLILQSYLEQKQRGLL